MKSFFSLIAVAALGTIVLAQAPAPTKPSQVPTGSATNAFEPITVIGCVEREADFRRDQAKSEGLAGAPAALADQFVLTHTSIAGTPAPTPGAPLAATTVEVVYQLTGPNEAKAQEFLRQRVEIAGRANTAESSHANPSTAATAAAQPAAPAAKPASPVVLPELEVLSIKPAAGGCA